MPRSSNVVRYAVVGLGHIAQVAVLPAFRHARNSRLAALVSGDRQKRAQLSRKYKVPAFAYEDRTICEIRSNNLPAEVLAWFPNRVVYVGGGPPVWQTYAPFIQHWDITRLPYDGEADRWFDPAWLVASKSGP